MRVIYSNMTHQVINDECSSYKSENGTDMTIYDRKYDYNENHLSLCEANCTFKGYNSSTSKANCECKTKSYLYNVEDFYLNNLLDKMENEQKLTNINIMKCSSLISSADDIKKNPRVFLISYNFFIIYYSNDYILCERI